MLEYMNNEETLQAPATNGLHGAMSSLLVRIV